MDNIKNTIAILGIKENNVFEAIMTNQPIRRYNPTDHSFLPFDGRQIFNMVPIIANPHIIPNKLHPKAPRITTNKNGV